MTDIDFYSILAIRRSGCHALAGWLGGLMPNGVFYCNNNSTSVSEVLINGEYMRLTPELSREPRPILYGRENQSLTDWCSKKPIPFAEVTTLLLIRDPFNHLASYMKLFKLDEKGGQNGIEQWYKMWIAYAMEATEFSNELDITGDKIIITDYNQWCGSREYRDALAQQIGFENKDVGIDYVSGHGGGSSFTKRATTGTDLREQVTKRYLHYLDNDVYREIISRRALQNFAKQLWPELTEEVLSVLDSA